MTKTKKTFTVNISETVNYQIEVEAKNMEEAEQKVWNGEVDFDCKDIIDSSVEYVNAQ